MLIIVVDYINRHAHVIYARQLKYTTLYAKSYPVQFGRIYIGYVVIAVFIIGSAMAGF